MTSRTSPGTCALPSMISRRNLLRASAAFGLTAGLPVLGSGTSRAAEPRRGGHLIAGIAGGSTTDTLDSESFNDTYMVVIGSSTRDNLTEIAANGALRAALAESWEPSKDARTWTFRLRKGVTFSNGKSLDTQDVIDSINAHRREDSKSGVKANLSDIESISADGKDLVVFKLASGNADFPYLLSDFHLNILPSKDGQPDWASKVGTGAYILEDFNPGVRSLLKLNPNRWDQETGFVDSAELLHINDVAARQAGLISGELHVVNRVDVKTAGRLKSNSQVRILDVPSLAHHTIPMMVDTAPFDNKDVRLALKYAIDREDYVAKILMGFGRIGNDQPIGPGSTYRFHAGDVPQHAFDPDKARYHLKQAGLDSLTVDLHTSDGAFSGAVDAAILYQEAARKAGININVIREPNDGYFSDIWPKTPFRFCWWSQRATEDQMLSVNYAASAAWNDTHWKNERFETLLREARSELDDAKRAELYREMQIIVSDDAGTIIPAFINNVHGVASSVGTSADISASWELDGGHFVKRWWLT